MFKYVVVGYLLLLLDFINMYHKFRYEKKFKKFIWNEEFPLRGTGTSIIVITVNVLYDQH